MGVGVPVLPSPVGVNSEIISDGKNGFLAGNDAEWSEKLSRLISDESLRCQFTSEARKTAEARYAASVHAPRVLGILEHVRQQRGRGRS